MAKKSINRAFSPIQATNAASSLAQLAIPASLPDAQKHQAASSVTRLEGVELATLPSQDLCTCCQLPCAGPGFREFRLCAGMGELAELGLGFPLFFLTVKWLMGMLFVVLCVASVPNLVRNFREGRKEEFGAKERSSNSEYWPAVLNAVALFLLCSLYGFLWFLVHRVAAKLDEGINTSADYALVFKNLGPNWTAAELKAHIEANMTLYGTPVLIEEISISYGTHDYIKQLNNITDLNIRYRRTLAVEQGGTPEEQPCRCCCCCLSKGSYMSQDQYQSKLEKCKRKLNELAKTVTKTGIAFVSLKTQDQVERFLERWKGRGHKKYFSCFQDSTGKKFKGRTVRVKRAPEPSDIIWENLVYSLKSRVLRTLVTTVLLAGILCCSFFILYGLAQWQKDLYDQFGKGHNESEESKAVVEFSSLPPAVIIFIFNVVLDRTVRLMAAFEHKHTHTDEILSTSWKLTLVMSLNTLLFPLLTHRDSSEWYTPGGLANNIFWVAISTAFVKPVFAVLGPMTLWKKCRKWEVRRVIERQSAYISQGQANHIYQNCEVDIAAWYAHIMVKFLLCLAYAPLLPLIVPLLLLGLGLEYWVDKWTLLRQSCRPRVLNEKIAFSMIDFVKPALVLYGISILIFFSGLEGETSAVGVTAVAVAVAFWIFHFLASPLFRKCFQLSTIDQDDYTSASPKFFTVTPIQTYQIANPFTHFDGLTNREEATQMDQIHSALQENWHRNYMVNSVGLLSASHMHIHQYHAPEPLVQSSPYLPMQVFSYPVIEEPFLRTNRL